MAIIGISGKIGGGKDTVGKIIQMLTQGNQTYEILVDLHQEVNTISSSWQIKKFAGKLKQIVSILTGIPVEELEKQEVKDSLLSEEWIRYGYANGFIQKNGQTIMNNEACSKERYEQELKTNWQTAYKHQYTVRDLLQLIGTEAMRDVIHPNVWVNALFADYKPMKIGDNVSKFTLDYKSGNCFPNWIITDMRFPNELKAIKDRSGITIRVNRPQLIPRDFEHPSETALDNATFDYIINNDGTIEELVEKVKDILVQQKILS